MAVAAFIRSADGITAGPLQRNQKRNRAGRQMQQFAREMRAKASQCRNRRVCETFNIETRRMAYVLFARAIRCFFSSLIEHNHFAQWYLAPNAGKGAEGGGKEGRILGNKIASVNRQPVTQDGNVLRASSDTKRRRRRKFVARFRELGDHNGNQLWHALRRG